MSQASERASRTSRICTMASTTALSTPSTLQALAPSPKQPQPKGEAAARQAPKRSGKQLWKTAAHKVHAYHAVTHQVQHRGAEKAGFGVAEHLLERVVEATIERVSSGAEIDRSVSWLHRAAAKPIKLAQSATCRLRSLGPVGVRCRAPVQVAPPSVAYRAWAGSLTGVKVLLPVAGTALVAHMAHHDLHRAQHERQMHGYSVATLLFYVACLCDALDAMAHALLVLLLLAELVLDDETLLQHHQLHLDHHHMHHLQHEMHHAGMLCAIGATLAVVVGEVLSVRAGAAVANAVTKIQAIKRGNQVRAELAFAKKKR